MNKIGLVLLTLVTISLRFVNLGYSEFQGDEIRTLYTGGSTFTEFLLTQRKGPIQYLVAYFIRLVSGGNSEFLTRLPFALVGALSVVFLYLIVKEVFDRRVALVAALLFSVNGFFVAFSRIVQYQSFNYFLNLLALYFFILLNKSKSVKYLYLGSLALGLGFLAHYDSVFYILPSLYFIVGWYKGSATPQKMQKLLLASLFFVFISSIFYLPYILHSNFIANTKTYLLRRASGEGERKETSNLITYTLYNPFLSFYLLLLASVVGAILGKLKHLFVYLWFVPSFVLLIYVFSIPGTHIYNFVIPLFILSAYGVVSIYDKLKSPVLKWVYTVPVAVCLIFLFLQSWILFVDHTTEYPWYPKKVVFLLASMPPTSYNLSIFGFPYNRKFGEINTFIVSNTEIEKVLSNENSKIIGHYVKPERSFKSSQVLYIYVYGPQSLETDKTMKTSGLDPVFETTRRNVTLAEVYLIDSERYKK